MFGLLQPSGQSSSSGNLPFHSPPVHKVPSPKSQTSQHVSNHRKRSSAASTVQHQHSSPINLPKYSPMTRPIRDERRLAPLPPLSHTSQPGLSLTCLADAALADARGPTSLPSPHPKAPFNLPPISSLIAPLPTPPVAKPDSSWSTTATTPYLTSSGSSSLVAMHTPPISRSHSCNANPAGGTDQPVSGRSTTAGDPSSAHITGQGPFPPPPLSQRPLKREKQRKQSQSQARATSSAVQLEYNVRPYNRMTASTSSAAAPSRQPSTVHAPTRTQPSRSSSSKLPHPLHGLTLDKTYPERKVEDWHNDAQNLLRPPLPPPNPIPTTSLNRHSVAQSLNPPPPPHSLTPTTTKKIHPPVESWENYTLPQMPGGQPCLPQTQPTPLPIYPHRSARRQQSSSSFSGTSWSNTDNTNAHTLNPDPLQAKSYVFVSENPEVFTRSRHRAPPISTDIRPAPYAMQRSQSAYTTQYSHSKRSFPKTISEPNSPKGKNEINGHGQIGSSLPTPITASMDTWWYTSQLEVPPSSAYQPEVLSLPQVQTLTPPLPGAIPAQRTTPIVPMEIDRQSTSPSLPPTRDITPIDQEMRNNTLSPPPNTRAESSCGSFRPPESNGQPELEAGESSYSESDSEPVSEDNQDQSGGKGHDRDGQIQVRSHGDDGDEGEGEDESYSNFGRSSIPNGTSAPSSNSSIRARSSSHSTHTSEMIKYEHSSSGSSSPISTSGSTSCFSPGKTVSKKSRTKTKKVKKSDTTAKGKGKGKGRSKNNGSTSTSVSASTTVNGQRRNGERRREQNAVAQKKFRWKKKQMAAKMEADLESATALASSLQKQVAEKDQLVDKLKGEVGSLKRKLKTLEA
ncbi:uncharacterized protein L199_006030 [Kwoniella botswanensis]|uniref:uncharacterized protein n=1 Tax=Kwoniella botswanensis TaxID=1268659 RepID=UPI00315DC024